MGLPISTVSCKRSCDCKPNTLQYVHDRLEVMRPTSPLAHVRGAFANIIRRLLELTVFFPHGRLSFASTEFLDDEFDTCAFEFHGAGARADPAENASVVSIRTVASTTFSLQRLAMPKTDPDSANAVHTIKLKTLEEHRFATRFEPKRVTPATWRKARQDADQLMRSGDRIQLVEALYLLLEIIWLYPRGCNLAPIFLNVGSIYLACDHLDEAAKAYRNCLRLDPESWKARYNLGIVLSRLHEFADAKTQLDIALRSCPPGEADTIKVILEEIERVVQGQNKRAMKSEAKARVFTMDYLQTLHLVAAVPRSLDRTTTRQDHTATYCSGVDGQRSHWLFHPETGWRGAIAGLIHRVYCRASLQAISIEDELLRIDQDATGSICLDDFAALAMRASQNAITSAEYRDLNRIFSNRYEDQSAFAPYRLSDRLCGLCRQILYRFLVPNVETCDSISSMQHSGAFHAGLHWSLTCKRLKRSESSRSGGFWRWLELSMRQWIAQVPLVAADKNQRTGIVELMQSLGWLTPMDFVMRKRLPDPNEFQILSFADRGILVFECHRVQTCIANEAAVVLQMFFRRNHPLHKIVRKQTIQALSSVNSELYATKVQDLQSALSLGSMSEQQIVCEVLDRLEDLIDEVVAAQRLERKAYEDKVRWQEIPVRTETRQHTVIDY